MDLTENLIKLMNKISGGVVNARNKTLKIYVWICERSVFARKNSIQGLNRIQLKRLKMDLL